MKNNTIKTKVEEIIEKEAQGWIDDDEVQRRGRKRAVRSILALFSSELDTTIKKVEPEIKREGYDFYVDGKKHEYTEYKDDKQDLVVCKCGNKTFWIYQPKGAYETNAICDNCRRSYCVHDG